MSQEQEQKQVQNALLATRFEHIEDRLILASLPTLLLVLIIWAIASAFPITATVINLIATILILIISCVVAIRLVSVGWKWWTSETTKTVGDTDEYRIPGAIGIAFLLFFGVPTLIYAITHAGQASGAHIAIVIGLFLILILQYRAIIIRYLTTRREQHKGE